MDENEKSFKSVTVAKPPKASFTKSVIIPFASGIIGASLVIGTCFGIPQIREKIFESDNISAQKDEKKVDNNRKYTS